MNIYRGSRFAVIVGGTLGLIYFGLNGATAEITAWLALVGAITLGYGISRVWPP